MTGRTISLHVHGEPVQQGSKTGFVVNGRAVLTESAGARHKAWRHAATLAARAAAVGPPLDGPLKCTALFRFAMPKSRPAATRDIGAAWKVSAPDLDKLQRAIGDSLTDAGAITDDARIVWWDVRKIETTGTPGASIRIEQIGPDDSAECAHLFGPPPELPGQVALW